MGGGVSADRKYVLRAVDTVESLASGESADGQPRRSRKNTAIYPGAEANQDTFEYNEVKLRPLNRRGSSNGIPIDEDSRKKAPLSRVNSKFDQASSKSEHGGTQVLTPAASQRGTLQTVPSAKNLIPLSASSPPPLSSQQSSSRLNRANSMSVSRTSNSSTICSVNYPWLLKSANVQGQSLGDFELGRVIGAFFICRNLSFQYFFFSITACDAVPPCLLHAHMSPHSCVLFFRPWADGHRAHRQE